MPGHYGMINSLMVSNSLSAKTGFSMNAFIPALRASVLSFSETFVVKAMIGISDFFCQGVDVLSA